jgi:hypothetical protein
MSPALNAIFLFVLALSCLVAALYWTRGWRRGQAAATSVADWVRMGMTGLGRAGSASAAGNGLLRVPLRYQDDRMRNASATVQFGPQNEPLEVVLRCDLSRAPRREALICSSRWGLCSRPIKPDETMSNWRLRRLGLYALTSERKLVEDYRELLHSLLESTAAGMAHLELDPESPHLTLTLSLESGGLPSPAPLFSLLRRLADTVPQHSR